MDGRLQRELIIDAKTDNLLNQLPAYMSEWNYNMKASKKTASTRHNYIVHIAKYLKYINPDVKNVKPDEFTDESVDEYMIKVQTKTNKNGEIQYTSDSHQYFTWCCLRCFFDFMVAKGYMDHNYIYNIKRPKVDDLARINEHRVLLTADDFKKLLREVEKTWNPVRRARNKAMLMVLMNTGMRETAMVSLMPDNIDLTKHTLRVVDKGNKRHEYILTQDTVDALEKWYAVRDQMCRHDITVDNVFISHEGNPMSTNVLYDWLQRLSKKALGYKISPHKIRSGLCSILYNETNNIEFVRRAIGHSNVGTTQRYIVTKGKEREEAAEIIERIL